MLTFVGLIEREVEGAPRGEIGQSGAISLLNDKNDKFVMWRSHPGHRTRACFDAIIQSGSTNKS